jgi:hypothetical protein
VNSRSVDCFDVLNGAILYGQTNLDPLGDDM